MLRTVEHGRGIYALEAVGELDLYTAPLFKQALHRLIARGARGILVDLTETTFIDSTALGVMIGAVKRLRPGGGELVIACDDPGLRRVFELTQLERAFAIFDSVADALGRLRSEPAQPPRS